MIVKEYACKAHGDFEAGEPNCPHGCSGNMVVRMHRTAPHFQSAKYRATNRNFEVLARDQGVTNLRNAGGDGMRRADYATHRRLNQATEMIVGAGKAIQGQDASQFFKPMGAMAGTNTGAGGALQRVNGLMAITNDQGAIPLRTPRVLAEASFDGRQMGLPAGES